MPRTKSSAADRSRVRAALWAAHEAGGPCVGYEEVAARVDMCRDTLRRHVAALRAEGEVPPSFPAPSVTSGGRTRAPSEPPTPAEIAERAAAIRAEWGRGAASAAGDHEPRPAYYTSPVRRVKAVTLRRVFRHGHY